jgi:hypothetical protein
LSVGMMCSFRLIPTRLTHLGRPILAVALPLDKGRFGRRMLAGTAMPFLKAAVRATCGRAPAVAERQSILDEQARTEIRASPGGTGRMMESASPDMTVRSSPCRSERKCNALRECSQ